MEKKNMVLLTVIAVATLLVAVVGATFAFFASSVQDQRTDENGGTGNTNVNTAKLAASTSIVANIENAAGSFTAENVYPGHKEVAALQVTAKGDADAAVDAVVPFVYEVRENTIGSNGGNVKVTLYKSETAIATDSDNSMGCQLDVDTTTEPGQTRYSESCTVEESSFGTKVGSTITLKGGKENVSLGIDTIKLAAGETEKTAYYYVVVEYENDPANDQSATQTGKTLDGIIRVA